MGVFVKELCTEWAASGVSVSVISPSTSALFRRNWIERCDEAGSIVMRVARSPLTVLPEFRSVKELFKGNLRRAWRLHRIHTMRRLVEICTRELPRPDLAYAIHASMNLYACQGVQDVYGGTPVFVSMGESAAYRVSDLFGTNFAREFLNSVMGVIAVSNEIQDFCVNKIGVPANKVVLYKNAVNVNKFYPEDKNIKEKVVIGFVGQFIPRKGVDTLTEAVEGLRNIDVMYVGDGPLLPSGENCIHRGPVDHELLPDFLQQCDIFVFPSKKEGSPNALIEAMATGLPIVASNLREIREVCSVQSAIFVEPDDVLGFRNAIIRLSTDKELRVKMGREARKEAEVWTLHDRAMCILSWMNKRLEDGE